MSGEITQVEARDESLKNSDIGDHEEDRTVIADPSARCFWNGEDRFCGHAFLHFQVTLLELLLLMEGCHQLLCFYLVF